jgi:hypothetical protein
MRGRKRVIKIDINKINRLNDIRIAIALGTRMLKNCCFAR